MKGSEIEDGITVCVMDGLHVGGVHKKSEQEYQVQGEKQDVRQDVQEGGTKGHSKRIRFCHRQNSSMKRRNNRMVKNPKDI